MKINLGSSDDLKPGFINVDRVAPPGATRENFKQMDLSGIRFADILYAGRVAMFDPEPWDFPDSSADLIVAHDVFEHVWNIKYPGPLGMFWCMNEAHRILKPGGILDLWVPCLPGIAPFCDPTHVQVWTGDHRYYFDERWNNPQGERGRLGPAYGITALFKTLPYADIAKDVRRTALDRPFWDWNPIQYAPDAPERCKLFVRLEAVK